MFEIKVSAQEQDREGISPPHVLMPKEERKLWILRWIKEHKEMSLSFPDRQAVEEYVKATGVRLSGNGECSDLKTCIKEMVQAKYIKLEYIRKTCQIAYGEKKGYYAYIPDVYFDFLLKLNKTSTEITLPSLFD